MAELAHLTAPALLPARPRRHGRMTSPGSSAPPIPRSPAARHALSGAWPAPRPALRGGVARDAVPTRCRRFTPAGTGAPPHPSPGRISHRPRNQGARP